MRRSKMPGSEQVGKVLNRAPGELEGVEDLRWAELARRASILRSAGDGQLPRSTAEGLARDLQVHWTTVYRWRNRLLQSGLVTGLEDRGRGFPSTHGRLSQEQEKLVSEVIEQRLRHHRLCRPVDLAEEVCRRCAAANLPSPSRSTVMRRWVRALQAREADRAAPGTYRVQQPLDVVQIDHTVSDVIVVDELYRAPIGRPYLTVALDVASRSILVALLSFHAPSAATVALCLARIATPKDPWIEQLGLKSVWPMYGIPRSIHLDNAPEFHSKALSRGCAQFGIELIHRPAGRPHYGGHIERSIGTLMSRFKTLPGATGSSTKDRKRRQPEKSATMTLQELERWLVIEIADRYHHRVHRGLGNATPFAVWSANPPALPKAGIERELAWAFLPAVYRKVRRDGIHFNHIQYWHPLFAQWAITGTTVLVHYDPKDLSTIYVRGEGDELIEAGYLDATKPRISLWECQAAANHLRQLGAHAIRETALFEAIEQQRQVIKQAAAKKRAARAAKARQPGLAQVPRFGTAQIESTTESVGEDPALPTGKEYSGEVWP